jgi:hypothetical protein
MKFVIIGNMTFEFYTVTGNVYVYYNNKLPRHKLKESHPFRNYPSDENIPDINYINWLIKIKFLTEKEVIASAL